MTGSFPPQWRAKHCITEPTIQLKAINTATISWNLALIHTSLVLSLRATLSEKRSGERSQICCIPAWQQVTKCVQKYLTSVRNIVFTQQHNPIGSSVVQCFKHSNAIEIRNGIITFDFCHIDHRTSTGAYEHVYTVCTSPALYGNSALQCSECTNKVKFLGLIR